MNPSSYSRRPFAGAKKDKSLSDLPSFIERQLLISVFRVVLSSHAWWNTPGVITATGCSKSPLHFSLSHSDPVAACRTERSLQRMDAEGSNPAGNFDFT